LLIATRNRLGIKQASPNQTPTLASLALFNRVQMAPLYSRVDVISSLSAEGSAPVKVNSVSKVYSGSKLAPAWKLFLVPHNPLVVIRLVTTSSRIAGIQKPWMAMFKLAVKVCNAGIA